MDEYIAKEALLLINSLYTGLLVMAYYDILRLFRRLIKHNNFFVGAEDFIFFIIAGFAVFSMVYVENDGRLRWFIIAGTFAGGIIYEKSFGKFLVKYTAKYVGKLLNIVLKKPITKLIMCIRYLFRKVVVNNVKKLRKKEKIS